MEATETALETQPINVCCRLTDAATGKGLGPTWIVLVRRSARRKDTAGAARFMKVRSRVCGLSPVIVSDV